MQFIKNIEYTFYYIFVIIPLKLFLRFRKGKKNNLVWSDKKNSYWEEK